ncbi:Cytochrome bd-type quinol oxidase, subunit 2 [Amycolatopsis arida]|uniref:Cytochrome bd-type quinol oxidase, subunit 2 n=1 Tax=Amycolatopsis arida TaxID=587909 RepID=A0A1I5YDS2_9PSEU|nr:cytochrome d ubiquinol oxidase subunit II [Amycolatopsis arida]TDX90443.1 cytochrome bd-type quinol oxidase subunit 2 [Amycolatopsis arida]SFQ42356.1 Cytochrome bd-type quinol oxidase, subunit 2 [Amycolatopsis arida]
MEILAVAVLGLFAVGWFVLGGADIGVGMVYPYLGRTATQRRLVLAAIGPFFLANEVWLLATAGVLVGAFPALEAELFHGLFPAIVALLVGWVGRDMGLWLRGRGASRVWHGLCDVAITGGSWVVALSWGWMFAGLLAGNVGAPPGGVAVPLVAAVVAVLFAGHGLSFAALRLTGAPRARAIRPIGRWSERRTFALTALVIAVPPVVAGLRLPLTTSAADPATLTLLVPALLVLVPFVLGAQGWVWWTFRHRVTKPSYL